MNLFKKVGVVCLFTLSSLLHPAHFSILPKQVWLNPFANLYAPKPDSQGHYRFNDAEYENYMRKIQAIDKRIYEKLRTYTEKYGQPAFFKAALDQDPTILIPTKESHGKPLMILPRELLEGELEQYLDSYRALEPRIVPFKKGDGDFSKTDYENYMQRIQQVDPLVHEHLRETEWRTGHQSLSPLDYGKFGPQEVSIDCPHDINRGFPRAFLPSPEDLTEGEKTTFITTLVAGYKAFMNTPPRQESPPRYRLSSTLPSTLTQTDRDKVFEILQSIDLQLYTELKKIDPTGENHIGSIDYGDAAVSCSQKDGFPAIRVEHFLLKLPFEKQRWVLAHEIGHYVLGHVIIRDHIPFPYHKTLKYNPDLSCPYFRNTKGHFTKVEMFKAFHNAFIRLTEYEADEFAVRIMGIDPLTGVAMFENNISKSDSNFNRQHPTPKCRIEHLQRLYAQEAHTTKRNPINWQALATIHKNICDGIITDPDIALRELTMHYPQQAVI